MGRVKIGKTELRHGLFLAPMAGVSDTSFRLICRELGAEYLVSEMISAKALCFEQRSKKKSEYATAPLAAVTEAESPMAVQIFGSEPEFMAEAARLLSLGEYKGRVGTALPCAIDINMGCPVHKVVGNGEGSALMKDIHLASRIVRAVSDAVDIPVTVKIRSGWNSESINAPEFARAMEDAGAGAICVHARTRAQMYSPGIDISVIEKVKRSVSIPVIGNGDIFSADDALRMLRESGCDGIMVARGAMGNPWIFSEITAALEGKEYSPPSDEEKIATAIRQADDMVRRKGEKVASAEAKKHLSWYTKGMRGASEMRNRINASGSIEEMKALLLSFATDQDK